MLFSKLTEGNFQIGGIAWEAWVNDPIYTLNAFRGNRELINFPKWENELYEHIVDCAEKESDLEKRKSYFLEAEKILIEELPVVPLFLVDSPGFKKRNFIVKNISPLMDFRWGYFIR
jgi:oligopeptide transport system substrate-binding protein